MNYSYRCTNENCTEREFSIDRSIKDDPLTKCPNCGSKINQIYKPVGIIWNATGSFGKSTQNK